MGRLAALLILLSQILLLQVAWETTGTTAIWFTFVGHPLLGAGIVLALWALSRRLRRERQTRN